VTIALAAIALVVVVVLGSAVWIVGRFRRTSRELSRTARLVADVKYALDQSAILAVTNTKGTITDVNDKFCEISKYSRDELLGQEVWRGELRNRAKDGSIYWVDTTIVPFLDAHGKPYQYMAIRYEITERKRQEALLREQAALARLGEMAAVVAHEVKNPIAGIRGALQVITSRLPADDRDRPVMGDIIARLDALNGIVEDLLLFSRPPQLKREAVDVQRLIDNTAELLRRDPVFSGVELNVSGRVEPVRADPEQLRIVFHNLFMNAAQAMGGHGAVEVTLAGAPDGGRIAIRDHGPGMSEDVRDKAFEPFFTTKHRGTGLGLPIARRIVEAHGGWIDIAPAPGTGTVISIALPFSSHPP
jgi:signal transduction histidine kinase